MPLKITIMVTPSAPKIVVQGRSQVTGSALLGHARVPQLLFSPAEADFFRNSRGYNF